MNSYVETIRLEGGRFHLLALHQARMEATVREVYGEEAAGRIGQIAEKLSDIAPGSGCFKCRVVYDSEIRRVEVLPYSPRDVRSLRVVVAPGELDYHLKSCDRSELAALSAMKGNCDEVIIVRDGLITDTSYTNLVFIGEDGMYTPRRPLLRGVMRESLLEAGRIREADLRLDDIRPGNRLGIRAVALINALLPLGRGPEVGIGEVLFE